MKAVESYYQDLVPHFRVKVDGITICGSTTRGVRDKVLSELSKRGYRGIVEFVSSKAITNATIP